MDDVDKQIEVLETGLDGEEKSVAMPDTVRAQMKAILEAQKKARSAILDTVASDYGEKARKAVEAAVMLLTVHVASWQAIRRSNIPEHVQGHMLQQENNMEATVLGAMFELIAPNHTAAMGLLAQATSVSKLDWDAMQEAGRVAARFLKESGKMQNPEESKRTLQ